MSYPGDMSASPYLTPAEVATELGISRHGVYKLIERGKLKGIRQTERNLRVSRLALDAYRRRLAGDGPPFPAEVDAGADLAELHASFEQETGMSAAEWERRWKADALEDSAENMRMTIRALGLRAAELESGDSARRVPALERG